MLQGRLTGITERVVILAAVVEDMLKKAAVSLNEHDLLLAHSVLTDREPAVNRMADENESGCIEHLALYQPEAVDLRTVVALLKINNSLERIADHVVNIVQRLESFADMKHFTRLGTMFERAQVMLHDSISALTAGDSEKARRVIEADRDMDEDLKTLTEESLAYIRGRSRSIRNGIAALLIGRDLERIADIATNICEDTIYLIEGEITKRNALPDNAASNRYFH